MRIGACRALQRGDDALTALYHRQTRCLDGKLFEIDALVKRLTAQPTGEVIDRSIRATSTLAPVAECGNLDALRAQPAPPNGAAGDKRIDELMAALADASVQGSLYGPGAPATIAALERDASALGWAPLIARVAYVAGHNAFRRDDPIAEAKLRDAALAAARAHDDILVVRASALAAVVLVDAGRAREAVALLHGAEVACARAGDPPDLRADVVAALADAAAALSKFDEADRLYAEAVDLLEKSGASPLDLAGFLNNWAILLLDRSDYARALPLSNRAVEILRKGTGNHHPDLARGLQTNGNLLVKIGKYTEAGARFDEALAIKEALYGPSDATVAMTVNSLGNVYEASGQLDRATASYQRAYDIWAAKLGPDHMSSVMARYNLAAVLRHRGKLREAQAMFEDVLARRQAAAEPPKPKIANALAALSGVYNQLGDRAKAIDYALRALAIREEVLGPETAGVAESLARVAGLWADAGDCAKARPAAERALAIDHKQLSGDAEMSALPALALAACDVRDGRRDAAIARYRHAVELLSASNEHREDRGRARIALADLLWPTDRTDARALATAAAIDLAPLDGPAKTWLAAHR
jgi:tetratricopeptide (TPR) repeat protein